MERCGGLGLVVASAAIAIATACSGSTTPTAAPQPLPTAGEAAQSVQTPGAVGSAEPGEEPVPARAPTPIALPTSFVPATPDFELVETPPAGCASAGRSVRAEVVGVQDWVRVRSEPSLQGEEVDRLDLGTDVIVFPDTLRYDGSAYWWVTVMARDGSSCGSVAANFLADSLSTLDRPLPGITYDLPTSGAWVPDHTSSYLDPYRWILNGQAISDIGIDIDDGALIDERLAEQLAFYEADGYEVPEEWYTEVDVPGADRAVRLDWISPSGDIGWGVGWIEVGDYTVTVWRAVYIEELDIAPTDEMDDFVESIEVERDVFLAALAAFADQS